MEQVDPEQAGSPELERGFPEKNRAEVKVRVNGVEYVEAVDHPRGDPANRLSDEGLREKFRRLARRRWTSERAEAVIAAVTRLEQAPDLSELSHWLRVDDGDGLPSR
jgi:2-methylcitrate dehydratase PrpD